MKLRIDTTRYARYLPRWLSKYYGCILDVAVPNKAKGCPIVNVIQNIYLFRIFYDVFANCAIYKRSWEHAEM